MQPADQAQGLLKAVFSVKIDFPEISLGVDI